MKMNVMKLVRIGLGGLLLCLLFAVGEARGWCQRGSTPTTGQQPVPQLPSIGINNGRGRTTDPRIEGDPDTNLTRVEEQQAKSRNSDRQKRLQTDTERLLALATELKQQVDKTDKNILSVDVIKKADEIEKLARSVKDRMKG